MQLTVLKPPFFAALAMAGALLLSTGAWACESHAPKAKSTSTTRATDAAALLIQQNVFHQLDQIVAGKCTCEGPADCTCKKNDCGCGKCSGHKRSRLFDTLKGSPDALETPDNARRDATAGVVI
jgi:hypothetical protein